MVFAQQAIILPIIHPLLAAHAQPPTHFAFNVLMRPTAPSATSAILEAYAILAQPAIKILIVEFVLLDTIRTILSAYLARAMFIFAVKNVAPALLAMFALLDIRKELVQLVILDIILLLTLHLPAHFVRLMSIAIA